MSASFIDLINGPNSKASRARRKLRERERPKSQVAGMVTTLNPTREEQAAGRGDLRRPGAQLRMPSGAEYQVTPAGTWVRAAKPASAKQSPSRERRKARRAAELERERK